MALTANQFNTLKAAIIADAAAGPMRAAGDTFSLLAWCNGAAAPAQPAWRTAATVLDVEEAPSYTSYDTLAQGKRDSWLVFLRNARDFSRNNVRKWVTDVWGNATAGSNAESILLAATESATNAQVKLGGGSKTTGTVTALDRSFTGLVSQDEANRLVA